MRLLNVNTRQLEEFFGDAIPPYAILSHTWGKEEVLLQDLTREGHQQKQGYAKIEGCCQQAIKDNLSWVWVDTCCIDKTSSAELSEAINSMFRWYRMSEVCYAYLQDVPSGIAIHEQESAFRKSRWFTRGWTLQELLAPHRLDFYDTNWTPISFSKTDTSGNMFARDFVGLISDIASIDRSTYRRYKSLKASPSVSAALVFSWMARRSTTRVEDEAYCLLGLLNINMPLLYGEGERAFIRLQEAILTGSNDISVLTSGYNLRCAHDRSYLARSPSAFLDYPKEPMWHSQRVPKAHTTVTGHGLHVELFMFRIHAPDKIWMGIVRGAHSFDFQCIGIALKQQHGNLFSRVSDCPPILIGNINYYKRLRRPIERKQIYIAREEPEWTDSGRPHMVVATSSICVTGYSFASSWPPASSITGDHSLKHNSEISGRAIICLGQHNHLFYMIFANEKQEGFAVRVEIEWGKHGAKVVKPTFCVLADQHIHTALEHCCGAKLGSKVPQFAKDMHWQHYFAAKNVTTNEIGYVYATDGPRNRRGEIESCDLWWKKGLYS